MNKPTFVHLNVHSEYSIQDGICRLDELIAAAKARGYTSLALTDHCNLFAQVKFYKAAIKAGIKPIIGADVLVQDDLNATHYSKLTLLSMNATGHHNLTCLISQSYTQGQETNVPVIAREWLWARHEGLIVLSGGTQGEIMKAVMAHHEAQARRVIEAFQQKFGNRFYLSVSRFQAPDEEMHIKTLLSLATSLRCPVVATNDVMFLEKQDFEAHEARVCIHAGYQLADPARPKRYSAEQYLKSQEEMAALFADLPGALENTVEIAKRCNVHLVLDKVSLPNFQLPANETVESFLRSEAHMGLATRFDRKECISDQTREAYEARLDIELDVIISMGFAGYFLIVSDFIRWSKANGIPVGPGRGSGAGSLVAFSLEITGLDPLKYDLLFERFLNPERVSMPDFDIDFCMDRRDDVIEYVAKKYGREAVSQIITFGTMAAKAVVRDVGRVLGHPYGFVDRIAKLIPFEIGITLEKAIEDEPALKTLVDEDEEVAMLITLAKKLEGITRNAGKHAGGVVIAPGKLTDFTPLYCEPGSKQIVSQLDKDDVESVGLVKFDFLGLRTLTIIDWACHTINEQREEPILIEAIPLQDPLTFKLLKACQTTAVFQLESRGMKDLIKRLQPDCFEDIVALVALFRPGPLQSGMVDDFIDRKHGRQKVEYPHPSLAPVLSPTYGVILYQEQVMQIAQVLSGYTLGAADLLRRAMGKKKPEEMASQRTIFVSGAVERGVQESQATYIFDLIEKFAGYGFNKSHSAAYALVAYQTAWLKAHYPAAFMAAVMSADMDNTDKVVRLIEECKQMALQVLPPDINSSHFRFVMKANDAIIYGLGAIKGAGEQAIENIIEARKQDGPFTNLFDFCRRVDLRRLNRRVLEALIKAGAMDSFGVSRSILMETLNHAVQLAEQQAKNATLGQRDMFFELSHATAPAYISVPEWNDATRLGYEKDTLGLYLTGHPMDKYRDELRRFVRFTLANLRPDPKEKTRVAGLLVGIRTVKTKQGKRMAILVLDDGTARLDVTLFADDYNKYQPVLVKDTLLVLSGTVTHDDFSGELRMRAQEVFTFVEARNLFLKRMLITVDAQGHEAEFSQKLGAMLAPYQSGMCPVHIDFRHPSVKAQLVLGEAWRIMPDDILVQALREWLGMDAVVLEY
ncbi:MAG: DNA polymerase III subunit alpha [Gammaproteobacteria bacterium]